MVQDVFHMFIEEISLKSKETTASAYYGLGENHILCQFKGRDISTISQEELINHLISEKNNHLSCKDKNLSAKTMYDITTLINSFWKYAHKNGYTKEKIHITVPKLLKQKVQIFFDIERRKLEEYILRHVSPCSLAVLLCLYTGLRIGEICALKWSDINLDLEFITVNKTILRIKNLQNQNPKTKIIIGTPKSETSIRQIPIPSVLIRLLKQEKVDDDCYVVTNTPIFIEPRLLQKQYDALLKSAKVTYKNFHTLRHTFATNAYNNGMGIKTLSEILGHSDIKITLNLYVHTSMAQKQKEMNLIYTALPTALSVSI